MADRVLPIYSADGSSLYLRVDSTDVYKEEDVGRDEFTGSHKLETLSFVGEGEAEKDTPTDESYWDANRGDWDNSALTEVISFNNITIICGDSSDADYVGAFEGCGNFTDIARFAGAPTLDGEHTTNFFKDCIQFNSSLQEWDFSNILRSDGMFDDCIALSGAALHNTLLKMHMDKNDAITPDNPQYIGAENVVIKLAETLTLIKKMRDVGQIVTGYESDALLMNSDEEYNTNNKYTYSGTKFVV